MEDEKETSEKKKDIMENWNIEKENENIDEELKELMNKNINFTNNTNKKKKNKKQNNTKITEKYVFPCFHLDLFEDVNVEEDLTYEEKLIKQFKETEEEDKNNEKEDKNNEKEEDKKKEKEMEILEEEGEEEEEVRDEMYEVFNENISRYPVIKINLNSRINV
jgi:hypothetical protein